jgi:TRAP-type C4-dicarboxylate transport system permease small subunit
MEKKWTPKRICALMIVILLVMMYIGTLVVAIVWPENASKLFALCLFVTVAVPVCAYLGIWIYTQATGKKTIASVPEIPGEKEAKEASENASDNDSETP